MSRPRARALVLVAVVVAAGACGDDGGPATSESAPPSDLRVVTFNAGLATGFVDHADERAPEVVAALAALDADVVAVQEVWRPADVAALTDATAARFPEARFLEPAPDETGGEPACSSDELGPLSSCVTRHCADVPPDEVAACVLASCGTEFEGLCADCQACLGSQVGVSVEDATAACTAGGGAYAYDGAFGIGILSRAAILDADHLVLESSLNRRAVLYALVDTDALGPVHVFATHLSAVFSDIPNPGGRTWEEEQAAQIEALIAYVADRAPPGEPVLLLGDLNTGPAGEGFAAEVPDNYRALTAVFDAVPYADAPGARCTFCADNPLVGGADDDESVLLDHVLVRDVAAAATAERVLDQPISLDVDGVAATSRLSDHYGVAVTLTP